MCVFLGSRISLHSPPSLTLSFHKPSDAELTYFLGAEIQKDERRFTSYFLLFFGGEGGGQEFWHLANQPLFLVFDIFISFHTFIPLFLQLTHSVCHVFPSLLFFSSHGYFYPTPGSFFLFSSSFHIGSFVDFFLSFCYLSAFLFILGEFFLRTF